MVGIAQLVEHLVVVQVVAGSSPVTHPNYLRYVGHPFRQHRCELSTQLSPPNAAVIELDLTREPGPRLGFPRRHARGTGRTR